MQFLILPKPDDAPVHESSPSGVPAVSYRPHCIRRQNVIVVIFESLPHPDRRNAYLDSAAHLRPLLAAVDGFISIERFESLAQPGKILSMSFWRDEEAVRQWRNLEEHRRVQGMSRKSIFADYRLRVASVIRDYGMNDRREAPDDSVAMHG
jgi:heme-degrading monooxygenase HmoA